MAVAGLSVAQEMGLSVPADLSIVAWDDSLLCRVVHPSLTALSRDIPAYGTHAVRLRLDLLANGVADPVQDHTAHLVPRGSTARPSSATLAPAVRS
jgi:DNA-binding LacI/PurR family transcriptional regulator